MSSQFLKLMAAVSVIGLTLFCLAFIQSENYLKNFRKTSVPYFTINRNTSYMANANTSKVVNTSKNYVLNANKSRKSSHITARLTGNISAPEAVQKQVLIVTYMRSGSSLTGEILQQSDNAFYVYEPLNAISIVMKRSASLRYVNGEVRKPPLDRAAEYIDVIRRWLECDIEKIPKVALRHPFLKHGRKTRMFPLCFAKENATVEGFKLCTKQLTNVCRNSSLNIVKTIRLPLHSVQYLLDDLPNLFVIHLVRDPRAILASQRRMSMCGSKRGGIEGCTEKFCSRVEDDADVKDEIVRKYTNRITTLRYEDLADHPVETSRKLYGILGTTFTRKAEEYIFNITMAGKPDTCQMCLVRSNSSKHVDRWKFTIRHDFLQIIQKRCAFVMKYLQYEYWSEQEMTDLRQGHS